jgi:hypothetical protein
MFIIDSRLKNHMRQVQSKKTELKFKHLLSNAGCSKNAADELWKWYDPSNKKGVASF